MIKSLITQSTYNEIQIGLFVDHSLQEQIHIPKTEASKLLILSIQNLLNHHDLSCESLDFIGSNQGPAPFTTLRVLIATINGIAFASNVPLVGVDGLKAFLYETENKAYPQTIILLNAFNKEVYYAYHYQKEIVTGYQKIEILLEKIKTIMPQETICFLGNGAILFQESINKTFSKQAFIPEPTPEFPSLESILKEAFKLFEKKQLSHQLQPLYLKK